MGRTYKGGKFLNPPQKNISRMYFIQGLLGHLYFDLQQFKIAIEAQHAKSPIPKSMQILISQYCEVILLCADSYPTKSGRVTKKGRYLVKQLRGHMFTFDRSYSELLSQYRVSGAKHQIICDLNWAVSWFIAQHEMTLSSLKVSTPVPPVFTKATMDDFIKKEKIALKATNTSKKVLPHRPKNWELIELFKKLTTQYKKINGHSKFWPYKEFCKQLDAYNETATVQTKPLTISERSYYSLRQAWVNGSLENFT